MDQFIGSHHNKIDAKGRVSVPATFRSVLKKFSKAGEEASVTPLVLRPSHQYPCIEGWTENAFEALGGPLEDYEQYSEEHEDLSIALFGDASVMETDKEGRIIIPSDMLTHAGITDAIVFIGARKNFQIWEPAAGARRIMEARAKIKSIPLRRAVPA